VLVNFDSNFNLRLRHEPQQEHQLCLQFTRKINHLPNKLHVRLNLNNHTK